MLVGHLHRLKMRADDVSGCSLAKRMQAETQPCEEKVEDVSNEDPGHLRWGCLGIEALQAGGGCA